MFFKRVFSIIIILFFIVSFFDVFALTKEEKWKILNNFEELQYEMIFENDNLLLWVDDNGILNTSRKIEIFWNISNKIENQRLELEEKSKKINSRVTSLKEAIKTLDEDIKDVLNDVNNMNRRVIKTKKEIEDKKELISKLKIKTFKNKRILIDYIIYLYKKWDYVYKDWEFDNLKAVLLSGKTIWEVIDDMYFKTVLEIAWRQLIDKYKKSIYELYVETTSLKEEELKLKKYRKDLMIKKKVLSDKKIFKTRLLTITKWKEDLYKKYINDKLLLEKKIKLIELKEKVKFDRARESLLKEYWCNFVDLSKNTIESRLLWWKCLDVNRIIYAESKLVSFSDKTVNIFSWPVKDIEWISAFFHDKEYQKDFGTQHEAIDIITPQWTDIYAPADWYVVYIEEPRDDNYAYIAIKHADSYITLYGHVSEILVKKYDFIKKWQVFAKSWWEYGTPWAWLLTTWPHLHFGVFKNKEYEDPLNYLNISWFDLKNLPDKYKYKYLADFKITRGYDYKDDDKRRGIFRIIWATEVERQKNLLERYAAKDFKDWNMWVEEALDWWIDPTFLICVWLAETGLWRNLKTPYNVWNIWNTDSGSTYKFESARKWIYWMVRTLNNKILWKYNKIKQLSRYWNKKWQIYASSTYNWHNNIVKCMSHIKGVYIKDDYNFRIED